MSIKVQRSSDQRASAPRVFALRAFALALAALALAACGSEADDGPPAASQVGGSAGFGADCVADADCRQGLICLHGDWAPKPFCTRACATAKDYCTAADTGGPLGLCLQLPDDFRSETKMFCLPICQQTADCKALAPMWEKCSKPTWKNKPLTPELPTTVCHAPSAQGQVVVDPVACDWQDKFPAPQYQNPKQVCGSYCNFLKTCKFWDSNKEKIECCTWRCFQQMTPQGAVDDQVEDEKKCYINAFGSAQGTVKVCDAGYYASQCGAIGDPHAP